MYVCVDARKKKREKKKAYHMKESKSPLSWRRTRCEVNWARMIYVYTQDTFSTKIKTVFYDPQEDNMNRKKSRTHPKRRDKKNGK